MKRIYLVRHAKPEAYDQAVSDMNRPLSESGVKEAHVVSQHIYLGKPNIDIVLCSPALRTKSTAEIFAESGLFEFSSIKFIAALYNSSAQEYLSIIQEQEDKNESLFLFGHNPSISELVSHLSNLRILEMSTCNVACLEFEADSWKSLLPHTGRSPGIISPAALFSNS